MAKRTLWLGACGFALSACATLGGFEDYSADSSAGASSGGTPAAAGKAMTSAGHSTASAGKGMGGSRGGTGSTLAEGGAGDTSSHTGGSTTGAQAGSAQTGGDGAQGGAQGGAGGGAPGGAGGGDPGLLADCVLLMQFEESGWSMKAHEVRDSSGLGNHGTPATTTLTTTASGQGKFGRAAKLDGSGGVVVPDAASLRASGAVTLAAWIHPTMLPGAGPGIISKRQGFGQNTAYTLFLWPDPAFLLFADFDGETERFRSQATFVVGQWYHVAAVFDGSAVAAERIRLYVNGALDGVGPEGSSTLTPFTSDLLVGDLPAGGDRFVGYLDEVGVWTRALSGVDIAKLFEATGPL